MNTIRALLARRETRAALAVWIALPTIFLFFNLTLAVDPTAHVDRLSLGAVVLDDGVATPQGTVSVGPKLVGALGERLGVATVAYSTPDALRDAVLAREVGGGIIVPTEMTARLQAGGPVELTVVRSDANDQFTNAFTASLASSLGPTLNAALPSMLGGTPAQPLVTVATDNVATATDFRFGTMPGFLLLPLWIGGVAFVLLLSRAGDHVRGQAGVSRTGLAEASFAAGAAGVTAAVVAIDIALFTWTWDVNALGLFAFLWVALTAIGWLLLGTVRTFGPALGAVLGIGALFLQQPISGAAYPPSFAPDVVRWAEPIAPLRYLVEGIRDVLIGGSTLADMAIALAWLATAGLVLVAVGAARLSLASRRHPAVSAPMPAA